MSALSTPSAATLQSPAESSSLPEAATLQSPTSISNLKPKVETRKQSTTHIEGK